MVEEEDEETMDIILGVMGVIVCKIKNKAHTKLW